MLCGIVATVTGLRDTPPRGRRRRVRHHRQSTQKKKEKRQRAAVKLEGAAGRELYLECLQIILRKQIWWLIKERGLPAELEEIVRAFWGLRVRDLPATDDDFPGGDSTFGASDADAKNGELSDGPVDTSRLWRPQKGKRVNLPMLIDTLALCYLGCCTLRLPISTATFCRWAQSEDLEFLIAINGLPKNVRDRLPATYHHSLQIRDHIAPGYLQSAVQELAISFNANYEVKLPPLNHIPLLLDLMRDLTLPVEIFLSVKCMAQILEADFCYPTRDKQRVLSIDDPEVLLLALVVVSTKLLHPLDGVSRRPVTHDDPRVMQIDWKQWEAVRTKQAEASRGLERGEEYTIQAREAVAMDNKADIYKWIEFFEKMLKQDGPSSKIPEVANRMFKGSPKQPDVEASQETRGGQRDQDALAVERYQTLNSTMKFIEPEQPVEAVDKRAMPSNLNMFYKEAAKTAAIPLRTLINAAAQVERRLELWCVQRERTRRMEGTQYETS
ncbi:ubiquitin-60s ribosomal protein l40 fusion protein [Apiospora kogelbergensis]|uniref:ubiquitin-60s ribosomal protein l40 fusion protein n=1 Tax=Apiospora kogelbergensis TaxID=1337665 RepID=UPI00313089D7